MINELPRVRRWLYGVLAGDATLVSLLGGPHIYHALAPEGAPYPHVVFLRLGQLDDLTALGEVRIWTEGRWQVKGVIRGSATRGSPNALQSVADRLEALLQAASGTQSGAVILDCHRAAPWERTYVDGGVRYDELGAEWVIRARPA